MPTIYDNIENNLLEGLLQMMQNAIRADFCVGYFNLRGWDKIADSVDELQGEDDNYCRLLIGMMHSPEDSVRALYESDNKKITQEVVSKNMHKAITHFAEQLISGYPTAKDERNLQNLAKQLRNKKLRVKFHGRHLLHAKLYLIHRQDNVAPLTGVVGSSNLTFAGLQKNGELNVDVLEQDSAVKLSNWFNDRWEDDWSVDISDELADIIEQSWARKELPPPYHIYLKTAYELSRDAIDGVNEHMLPSEFREKMLDFQAQAVQIAAKILHQQNGVIIGDVVGLGKTIIASAVAKVFQEDEGDNVLVICPPRLKEMWKDYLHNYKINGMVFSSGRMKQLEKERHYRLIIVDESHNFRNRDTARYSQLHDYIVKNDSRVILLTATPYNKGLSDIANQLRLFVPHETDLGIRPDNYINQCDGIERFNVKHSKTLASSLAAFEHSKNIDDWRELMRRYLVRRTRSHIIKNFAEKDDTNRPYLTFNNGEKFYFPTRVACRLDFSMSEGDTDDDYAKLYLDGVAKIITKLKLPRYGLGRDKYINGYIKPNETDEKIINNLTRAGTRLRGFARSGLFKRLESGGDTFLLSIRRHINRNAAYIAALDAKGKIPIGQIYSEQTDEALEEEETANLLNDSLSGIEQWQAAGKALYDKLKTNSQLSRKFQWISTDYFSAQLREDLKNDIEKLLEIHRRVPQWRTDRDRKLHALYKLVQKTHGKDKVLIFTQFTDTAEYLHRELKNLGVKKIELVHGGIDNITDIVKRFSPHSNDQQGGELDELRIIIATDVLSEGQNLQDAHIIVNYDLPWAIIRLIQRVGRVDRIGQKAQNIFCYSALPEKGIEKVIKLRKRLRERMTENAELVNSDEIFFEDDKQQRKTLDNLYSCDISLEETDNETDLLSRAFDIWQRAIKDNPELANTIKNLPNIVYSAKKSKNVSGVIAYVRDSNGNNILAHVDEQGKVVSQSQSHILDLLECKEDTPQAIAVKKHHDLVRSAVHYLENNAIYLGGQLGGANSVRHKLYTRLNKILQNKKSISLLSVAETAELGEAVQQIYDSPLTEIARDRFRRLLQYKSDKQSNNMLQETTLNFYQQKKLCIVATGENNQSTNIICSMGLIK